ncbi:SMP-30/gluconolactonase/LRE family protein [Noviherbaspirillum sp.]|uniref:SMP-30/gluconolactonase/LRE family protein n=1 Tax=Noviherbaspirillum sp. TaxID=1926288 RepID=UPI002D401F61|nr:SMP-30/gluconolactonase/LRE family protein [Noviherbaspirillum sp.]HZW23407.1 SMP-30/gluconolactonase/LRE family protein [Noviherbaspirillum sp.]
MMHHHLKKPTFMPANDLQALPNSRVLLGESPLWHPQEQALYWIDIAGLAVHRFDPVSKNHRSWSVPSEPGCIAWCADGGLLVAMRAGISILDTEKGSLHPVVDAPYDPARIRFNDGRCDAAGRLWVGTLSDDRSLALGALYCLERGVIKKVGNPVTVSNGLAFSLDGRTLYHADTTAHRISAFTFDQGSGGLGEGRLFRQFSDIKDDQYGGRPDGASVDSENAYWCAMYEGGKLLRLSPDGSTLDEVPLPARCPTMPAFGGRDLRTLYVTTVRNKRPGEELRDLPLSGCVLSLRVDVPGITEHPYRA